MADIVTDIGAQDLVKVLVCRGERLVETFVKASDLVALSGVHPGAGATQGLVFASPSLPTVDPGVAGAIWADAESGHVVKISQG